MVKISPPVRVGLIGTGRISDLNVLGYLDNPRCTLAAVADPNEKVARQRLAKWGVPEACWYADYEKMIRAEDLHVVEILTPHHLHAGMTIRCAELGVSGISVQKPMATTIHECQQMIDACATSGTKLKVFENFVFYPPYRKAKALIDEGIIGEVQSVYVRTYSAGKGGWKVPLKTWLWRVKSETCGGGPVVFDDGFHKFSWAWDLLGRPRIEKVKAWIDDEGLVDSPAYILFETGENPTRHGTLDFAMGVHCTWPSNYYACEEFIEVTGTKGWLRLNQCTSGGNSMSDTPQFPPIVVCTGDEVTTHGEGLERDWGASFRESGKHFVECMIEDAPPVYTGEEGLYLTKFAKAPYVSAQEHREVRLAELTPAWDACGSTASSGFKYWKAIKWAWRTFVRGPATKYNEKI